MNHGWGWMAVTGDAGTPQLRVRVGRIKSHTITRIGKWL